MISEAAQREYLTEAQAKALMRWREDAAAWSRQFEEAVPNDGVTE